MAWCSLGKSVPFLPKVMTFAQLVKQRRRVRRAITTANSRLARRSVQKDLPLETDAVTTGRFVLIKGRDGTPLGRFVYGKLIVMTCGDFVLVLIG